MEYISNIMVVIMRGLSGSGKTTFVKKLANILYKKYGWDSATVSTDNYFMVDDKHVFDASKKTEAHANCFRQFLNIMCNSVQTLVSAPTKYRPNGTIIFVDNTNIRVGEYTPYYLAAESQGILPIILRMETPLDICIKDNVHNLSDSYIRSQLDRAEPPFAYHVQWVITRDEDIDQWAQALIKQAPKI